MRMPLLSQTNRGQYATLLDAAALNPADDGRPAVIYVETGQPDRAITRAEFARAARHYASALAAAGVSPGDLVVIAHTQNLESMFSFWGALAMGAIPSMFPTLTEKLDPEIYKASMSKLVSHSGARLVLTSDDFAPQLAAQVGCPVLGSAQLVRPAAPPAFTPPQAPDEVAFLQHSSGTTGLQKGVALSHRAVLNQLASYSDALQLNDRDVIVSWLPLYHDMGLIAGFLLPLVVGIPLVLMSPFDWVRHPAMLLRAIHEHQGTYCWLPNFAYNHCARRTRQRDSTGLSLKTMRAFINCSEPVYHDSHEQFCERFAANGATLDLLAVSYAMAENTFAVTQTPIGQAAQLDVVDRAALENERRAAPAAPDAPTAQVNVSCGPPIAGTEVRIIDAENGAEMPERAVGEVAIRSNYMLSGYYQRPDLNAHIWHAEGWYRTGDMGYMANGELYISGRKKDLIINGGKNVYPQDLEAIVNGVPGVHPGRAAAFGVYDGREGTELIGIAAEVDCEDEAARRQIAQEIRARIARQTTVTASFVHLVAEKWLIKTSSGKIARAANRDKWARETGRMI